MVYPYLKLSLNFDISQKNTTFVDSKIEVEISK